MTPLVNHPAPYEDESLASYVERLARANYYDPPRLFGYWLRAAGNAHLWNAVTALRQPVFYQRLSDASGQSATRLVGMTVHAFAPVLMPPGFQLDELVLAGQVHPLFPIRSNRLLLRHTAAAFCPACLREACYHRRHWQVTAVAACLRHGIWLLDCCPVCERPLAIEEVTVGCCSHCRADLREQPALPDLVDEGVLQAQRCLYAWLNDQAAPSTPGLPDAPPAVLFRVLDGLRTAVQVRERSSADVRYRLSPQWAGYLYGAAFQGLKEWPEGFFGFLDAYRTRENNGSGVKNLGTLYSTWLEIHWRHPAFSFVQEAFNRYLTSHFPPVRSLLQSRRLKRYPELVGQFAYIDVRNAARLTRTSPPKIARLIRDGLLDVYPEREPLHPGVFLYRSQVEAFVESPSSPLRRADAADYLGVELPILYNLLHAGLIPMTGPRTMRGPTLTYADLDDLCARLRPWVETKPLPSQRGLPLGYAAVLNGKVGLGVVDLLERILAGKLSAYHPSPDLRPLRHLWFEESAILALTEQVKAENNWASFMEVLALLGVGRLGLHDWMASGLLSPVASFARAQYFERSAVMDLRARRVTGPEAAQLLHSTRTAISQWVHAGFLTPLSGPGVDAHSQYSFDRQVLEDWQRTYVSASEVKLLLNATDPMLRRWRQDGKLTRLVSDRKIAGFYSRDEVLALQKLLSDS